MRGLIILASICAVVYGRAQISEENQNEGELYDPVEVIDDSQFTKDGDATTEAVVSDRRAKYRNLPEQPSPSSCREKNERYPVPGSCDRYIECLNGTAEEKTCPDGLRYNPNVNFNVYPCQYPIDVPCLERSANLQPAQPTELCPHQFGYFKTGDAKNCSGFRNCVNGVGYDFTCPDGLAFSSDSYRCEWPDESPDCDAEAFLGFRCPPVPESREFGSPAGFRFYRSSSNCQNYFMCLNGKPRRLSCGGYSAFDESTESCISAVDIPECPSELRSRAAQIIEEEKQRNSAEAAFSKLRYLQSEDISATESSTVSFDA